MSKGNQDVLTKGPRMEELLRSYFLKTGYYVVRGVPFIYEGFDVTDIDLWLYSRTSSVSREVALVDAKNKKTRKRLNAFSGCRGCGSPQGDQCDCGHNGKAPGGQGLWPRAWRSGS